MALAASVAVAFADSSIVVLALPDLYGAFDTTIVGVSWVITSYNVVVALVALLLVPAVRRLDPRRLARVGLTLFTIASAGCAASWNLEALIVFRCLQGLGAALLLPASLALLGGLLGVARAGSRPVDNGRDVRSRPRAGARRGAHATLHLAGDLRRAGSSGRARRARDPQGRSPSRRAPQLRRRGALAADVSLALVFGALVGALFLSVLLVITVWRLEPVVGALVVSALPAAALAVRP